MQKFRMWHAECETEAEGEVVEAETAQGAAKRLLFRYYEGDCDHGADRVEEDGVCWLAFRKGSPDYFHIKKEGA
jgi:hypothetical protein